MIAFAQGEFFIREKRSEILKGDTFFHLLRVKAIDANDFIHREVFVTIAIGAERAFYGITRLKSVLTNLLLADIYIVRRGDVVVVSRA